MNHLSSLFQSQPLRWGLGIVVIATAGMTRNHWWPVLDRTISQVTAHSKTSAEDEHTHSDQDAHHDHAHEGAISPAAFIDLSPEALKNLGLSSETLRPIQLGTFQKTINVPAIVVERPGQTLLQISTPMTGVVTEVTAIEGATVEPGQPLFRIRLTHEDLVQTQTDFVRTLGELDVEKREISRLEAVTEKGAIAGKSLLERQYAKEKLDALIQAQREALRLHGLSQRQIDQMAKDRRLLSELTIISPSSKQSPGELKLTVEPKFQSISYISTTIQEPMPAQAASDEIPLVVERLSVQRGQSVEQGGQLCVLANYRSLYIEGQAFEQDVDAINKAVGQNWKISALLPSGQIIESLNLVFVASEIDPDSRTLKFFVDLPNQILRDTRNSEGQRFITWNYKPGQRMQLRVPVEELPNQIVLPLEAVAREGAESFVYQRIGKTRFNQVPVHVLHRDQTHVVVANDGALYPGDILAWRSAHQLHMAIKNKSGGGIDPHAGHTH